MPFSSEALALTSEQRADLEEMARSQSLPAAFVLRAKILLLLADGWSYQAVADKLDTSRPTVGKWKKRFLEQGLDGLETHRPGQRPSKLTPRLRARILDTTPPPTRQRLDPLVLPQTRRPPRHRQGSRPPRLARGRSQAAPARPLQGFGRSRL